ncbi:hypothetical protein B0T25DRAFT_585277 [Lasiosphaeria hispida]|uniref:Uncharacterized protein n=1 Tax=Lasiosphaeria hispida TaxID=260671 RepID=A0AAJ0H9Z5_9PEZI|nr:hypothetical protein B0T25DRAFT_585277 [Lasiosphaeria hispida]
MTDRKLGYCLGPFAYLVSLHRRLRDLSGKSRPEDAPWADRFADPGRHRPHDDGSPLQPFLNRSGHSGTYHLACGETEDDFSDGDDDDGEDEDRGDLSSSADSAPMCMADAQEQTFKFSPIAPTGCHPIPQAAAAPAAVALASKEGKTAQDQEDFGGSEEKGETRASRRPAQPTAFRVRVNGGIPTCPTPMDSDRLVAIFKAKCHQCNDNNMEVQAQQTMEHVAMIWEKHKGHKPRVPDKASSTAQQQQQHHTLMITQDATDIFFNYSTYEDIHLDYLFGPASAGVVPSDADIAPCLVIQELGPFSVNDKQDLRVFVLAHC